MSESRAKKERQKHVPEAKPVKKDRSGTIINIVIAVVILVVAALGGYAAYEKIKQERETSEILQNAGESEYTIADVAAEAGVTVQELLEKTETDQYGFTAETSEAELFSVMTLRGYANYKGVEVGEFKQMFGIENLDDTMLWNEAQMNITMQKVAEVEWGISFEEFAMQNGLPAEITADTTYGEAMAIMQTLSEAEAADVVNQAGTTAE